MKKSAVMIDAQYIEYVCPENRKNGSTGHFFRVSTGEVFSKSKWPKCPYCKAKTKMINYEQKLKEQEEQKEKK